MVAANSEVRSAPKICSGIYGAQECYVKVGKQKIFAAGSRVRTIEVMKTRRCYCLWIPAEIICTLLGDWRKASFISLPFLEQCADGAGNRFDLPSDYICEDATHCWQRRAIGLLISHPTFPECQDGMEFPNLYYRQITIQGLRIVSKPFDPDLPDPIVVEAP